MCPSGIYIIWQYCFYASHKFCPNPNNPRMDDHTNDQNFGQWILNVGKPNQWNRCFSPRQEKMWNCKILIEFNFSSVRSQTGVDCGREMERPLNSSDRTETQLNLQNVPLLHQPAYSLRPTSQRLVPSVVSAHTGLWSAPQKQQQEWAFAWQMTIFLIRLRCRYVHRKDYNVALQRQWQ